MPLKFINGNPLKEASSNIERALLGLLDKTAQSVDYGEVSIEAVIKKGEIKSIKLTSKSQTINSSAL